MKKRHFLVTGGNGFIGSALVRRLVAEGHEVRVFDNKSRNSGNGLDDIAAEIEFIVGSVCDAEAVSDAARGVDSVIHLAAINGTEFFYSRPEQVLDVGVRGMLHVIDACRARGVGEMIVASSSEVYQFPETVPTDETAALVVPDLTNPRYSYAGSKIISELLAMWWGRAAFERVIIFRPHNVYGPNMGWEHVLPHFILRAMEAVAGTPEGPVPFPIQGDGNQTRAFMHVDDCIDGVMLLIDKGEHLGVYHLGNPEELEIAEVARRVVAYFGHEVRIDPSELPPGGTPRRCPDIGRMRGLGFMPKISFDQGLASIAEWYVAHAGERPGAGPGAG